MKNRHKAWAVLKTSMLCFYSDNTSHHQLEGGLALGEGTVLLDWGGTQELKDEPAPSLSDECTHPDCHLKFGPFVLKHQCKYEESC